MPTNSYPEMQARSRPLGGPWSRHLGVAANSLRLCAEGQALAAWPPTIIDPRSQRKVGFPRETNRYVENAMSLMQLMAKSRYGMPAISDIG
jgi:hypothetical protein